MCIHRCLSLTIISLLFISSAKAELTNSHMTLEPAGTSVLASGKWYKIKINKDGIYRLTYEDLLDMGFSNPSAVRLYGNGGTMLPLMNNEARYDDLIENRIFMYKGTDGIFNQGDYILFYGKGPDKWTYNSLSRLFEHQLHAYSNVSCYFITTDAGEGLKIGSSLPLAGEPDVHISDFIDHAYHEREMRNLLKSGRQWFGERIDYSSYDTSFGFPGLVASVPVRVKMNVVSRSDAIKAFFLMNNSTIIGSVNLPSVNLENTTGTYASQMAAIFSFPATGDQVNLKVSYNKNKSSDEGFLDYLIVNVRRQLIMTGNSLFFRDTTSVGMDKIAEYTVENCNSNTEIWEITDRFNICKVPAQLVGSSLVFSDSTKVMKQYVALNTTAGFPKPEIDPAQDDLGFIENQNLHGTGPVQMLIITNPLFADAADSIAEFHRQKDSLTVFVAKSDQIYNEFSSGITDISALRDFTRMIYNKATGDNNRLRYLLLIGDGSFNNKSNEQGNTNFIPTYQSESSLNASSTYVSDDFFGFMHQNEGGAWNMGDFSLDLGVGRLPVKTSGEALAVYRKIKNYADHATMGNWRNNILFAADDEDGNLHMTQANNLADWIDENYPQFVVKKVLIDAYHQVSTSTGARYPEVNQILNDNMNKGLLIFNYTGHGSETYIAAEHILEGKDLENYQNDNNLPMFVTATCEFSRFDDLTDNEGILFEKTSAGESSLLNPNGGSIALFSTTRIVYSDQNHYLNTKFYEVVFERDANNRFYKLGDITRISKELSGTHANKLNFILLGDPALTLAIPNYTVVTDSLNGISINEDIDTLSAFSVIRIAGHLEDFSNKPMNTFNGILYPSVYDKSQVVTTLANDNGEPMQFNSRENLIYKGKASIENGRFSFSFIVPKDIRYNYGNGKINYYCLNSTEDGCGYFNTFIIGGTNSEVTNDDNGPQISLYLNDEYFNDQGITNTNPVIYALVSDESGINTTGNGIGHDITGIIDGDIANPVVLNDFFETKLNDYTSGILQYPMYGLEEGKHSLKLKVWDVFNNSSEETIEFRVLPDHEIIISNLFNYPNPAGDQTWFIFEHNKPGEELTVTLHIFDMEGRNVAVIQQKIRTSGFSSTPISWDLKDMNGNYLRQGIYPYRVRITTPEGLFTESYQKLVIIRQ